MLELFSQINLLPGSSVVVLVVLSVVELVTSPAGKYSALIPVAFSL
jgi:hypothetical protein